MPAVLEVGKEYYDYLKKTPCGVLNKDGSVAAEGKSADDDAVGACMITAMTGVGGKKPHGAIGAIVSKLKGVGVSFTEKATWIVEDLGNKLHVIVIQTNATNYHSSMRTDGKGTTGKNFCEVLLCTGGRGSKRTGR